MRVSAAELTESDARVLEQYKARAAEEVEYCNAMKARAGRDWNSRNLEAALELQRMLSRDAWEVDDVHRFSNELLTGDFHENLGLSTLRFVVEHFIDILHRTALTPRGSPRRGRGE
jgi:hypothetical protein